MKVSDGEKLILIMLSELYERLQVKDGVDSAFVQSALFSGNTWAIPWRFTGIPFEDQETPAVVEEVFDILDMWSRIERSYRELSGPDRDLLAKEAGSFGRDVRFRGFDGNCEPEYMGLALFIINDLERFREFAGRDLNSHMPSLGGYQRMLSAYRPRRAQLTAGLSVSELAAVLKEQAWPGSVGEV